MIKIIKMKQQKTLSGLLMTADCWSYYFKLFKGAG